MSLNKVGLLMALSAALASAQLIPGPIRVNFPPALQSYLELSPTQVASIQRLNTTSAQFQSEKARRSIQVQSEIAQETAKPTVDAMALGLRYMELEAIRREIAADNEKTHAEIQKLLNDAQKTKVQALVAAMRLQSVICEAQSQNILPAAFPGRVIPTDLPPGQTGFASFLLGRLVRNFGGCSAGSFSFIGPAAEEMPR